MRPGMARIKQNFQEIFFVNMSGSIDQRNKAETLFLRNNMDVNSKILKEFLGELRLKGTVL